MDHSAFTFSFNEHSDAVSRLPGKPLLDQLLDRCTFPKTDELGDHMCHICDEPFLGLRNLEIPIKLSCGHIYGLTCILRWLNPLSHQRHNSCPTCRHPIFGSSSPSWPRDEETDTMRHQLPAVNGYSSNPDHLEMTIVHSVWLAKAETLWIEMCEELVQDLEATQSPSDWLLKIEPMVKAVINNVTVRNFIKEMGDVKTLQAATEKWWMPPLALRAQDPLLALIRHLEHHPSDINVWTAELETLMPTPTEADYLRLAGYHRRIVESHASLASHVHASLDSAEE